MRRASSACPPCMPISVSFRADCRAPRTRTFPHPISPREAPENPAGYSSRSFYTNKRNMQPERFFTPTLRLVTTTVRKRGIHWDLSYHSRPSKQYAYLIGSNVYGLTLTNRALVSCTSDPLSIYVTLPNFIVS